MDFISQHELSGDIVLLRVTAFIGDSVVWPHVMLWWYCNPVEPRLVDTLNSGHYYMSRQFYLLY